MVAEAPRTQLRLSLGNRHDEVARVLAQLHALHAEGHLPAEVEEALCVVVDELLNNLLRHALPADARRQIELSLAIFAARVELELVDDGPPFNPIVQEVEVPRGEVDGIAVGGLGLHLVKSLVDQIHYRREGERNRLTLIRAWSTTASAAAPTPPGYGGARGRDRRRAAPVSAFPIYVRGQRIERDRRAGGERRNRTLGALVSLFAGVDRAALEAILADCPLRQVPDRQLLIRKGEHNTHLYVLLAGELRVQLDLNDPSPIPLGPGECVGELSLIDGEPASAHVVAEPGSRLIVVAEPIFREQIMALPGVARNLLRAQSKRLRANNVVLLAKLQHELQLQQMERDLQVAAEIQRGLLPRHFPLFPDRPEIDLHATMRPAREIGGDFYDALLIGNHLVFALGDVSGKGIAAALFMAQTVTLLRTEARHGLGAAETLRRINRLLCEENSQNMFVTVCLGTLDLSSGRVRLGNAGHLPPLHGEAGAWQPLPVPPASLLGVWDDAEFSEIEFQLAPGDGLLLYSDGVTEARPAGDDSAVEMFGEARLRACLAGCDAAAAGVIACVEGAVADYARGRPPFDDAALLALRYCGRA